MVQNERVYGQSLWIRERHGHELREVEHGEDHSVQAEDAQAIFKCG